MMVFRPVLHGVFTRSRSEGIEQEVVGRSHLL